MRAQGVDVPEGIEIEVVESTATKHYVVMPPLQTGELSDEQLAAAQGRTYNPMPTLFNCEVPQTIFCR